MDPDPDLGDDGSELDIWISKAKAIFRNSQMFEANWIIIGKAIYYTQTKTFYENGYTYQCDVDSSGIIILYNKANKWTNVKRKFKDTGEDYSELKYQNQDWYVNLPSATELERNKAKEILARYKSILGDCELFINFAINSETGKVEEVYFEFDELQPYVYIPISVFREIEERLIGAQYQLTGFAKRLNYLYMWWPISPYGGRI